MNRMYYAYARHALVAALRMARVQPGDTVLLPHFICRDVLASLKAVQAVPVFYHVDENLQVPPSIKLPPARTVLAVNYFGFPADLEQLQQQLTDQNSVIIEDNAHGWLSADQHGIALGTRTSLGITSFRKTILCPDGAFLHWKRNQQLDYAALPEPLRPRDESVSFTLRLRRGASQLERTTHLPMRSMARSAIRLGRRIVGRAAIVENPNEEFELPRCQSVHASSLDMMMKVDQCTEIARRRTLFEQSADLARHYNITPVFDSLPDGVSPQGFAFYGINGDEDGFRRQIQRRRLGETMSWPHLPQRCQIPADSPLRTLQLVNFIQ